jgi:hypothetical protein
VCVVAVQIVFAVTVVSVYVLLFLRVIRKLDAMMKRTRAMVLLLPDEIITGIQAIRTLLNTYSRSLL